MTNNTTDSPPNQIVERDLHKEANEIKQKIVSPQVKPEVDTYDLEFTPMAEVIIEGLNSVKIRPSVLHQYVPDHFFIGHLIVRMFETIRNDKHIKKNEDFDPYGFLLYVYYALMYVVLRSLNNLGVTDTEAQYAQTMFENAGFTTATLPMILNQWVDGIGTYVDDVFGKRFEPRLPKLEITKTDDNNGFWSKNTAHLLPNFLAIMKKLLFFSDEPRVGIKPAERTLANYRNLTYAPPFFANFDIPRAYDSRIPGVGFITRRHVSSELASLVFDAVNQQFTNNYAKYFRFSSSLLDYLVIHYRELVGRMSHFSIERISDKGNDLIVAILRELEEQDVIHHELRHVPKKSKTEQPEPSEESQLHELNVDRIIVGGAFAHNSRVYSKSRKVNGITMIASVSPITRLAVEQNRIPFPEYEFVSPYHPWFNHEYEFQTEKFTLEEAHAKFVKQKSK